MAFHKYQVDFDEDGNSQDPILLPDPPPKKRTIIVIEETPHKARRKAEDLYSIAT